MQRILTHIAFVPLLLLPTTYFGQVPPVIVDIGGSEGHYQVGGDVVRQRPSRPAAKLPGYGGSRSTGRPQNPAAPTPPPLPRFVVVVTGPDGECLSTTTNPTARLEPIPDDVGLGPCPAPQAEEGAEEADPGVAAEQAVVSFWTSRPVPRLAPVIEPGWAITGLRAYLETGPSSATRTQMRVGTPVGTAVLDATADIVVDWGDGTPAEVFSTTGGPYPDGPISHVYTHTGTVTVTVSQTWGGSWRVVDGAAAGVGGALPALPLGAAMQLPVDEIQAVIRAD